MSRTVSPLSADTSAQLFYPACSPMSSTGRALVVLVVAVAATGACKGGCSRGRDFAGSALAFEGQIDEETTGAHPEHVTYLVKGLRARMDHPGRTRIWDGTAKRTYGLDTAAKTYTERPYDVDTTTKSGPSAWTRTGRTDVVAGHPCQSLETAPKPPSKAKQEACLADDIEVPGFGASPLTGLTGLRMRLVAFDATGAEQSRTEVTRVEARSIPDSVFDVPPGYTRSATP
jgi:hypothetical protein